MASQTLPSLPVIDFTEANCLNPGSDSSWLETAEKVRLALEEHGCFIATNNKVSSEISDAAFQQLNHLFELPTEIKSQNVHDIPYLAYTGPYPGFTILEALGIGNVTDEESILSFSNRMWPTGNDQFCETMNSFIKLALKVDQMVTRMVFDSYGVEKYLGSHVASTKYTIRLNKYKLPAAGESNFASQAHTDKTFLTVLHQNGVDGLEVQTKNGDHWITMELPPSSCIVMAGEGLLAWSNGRVHSPMHQVRMSSTGANEVPRYSIGLFSMTGKTDIPEELVDDEDHPRQFTSFDGYDLQCFYFTPEGLKSGHNTARAFCGV